MYVIVKNTFNDLVLGFEMQEPPKKSTYELPSGIWEVIFQTDNLYAMQCEVVRLQMYYDLNHIVEQEG